MRNATFVAISLAIFGLVPVAGWLALAANLDPAGLGRAIGKALLVVFSPMPTGGLAMFGAACFVARGGTASRVVATIGTAVVLIGLGVVAVAWMKRFASCGPSGACTGELAEALAILAYAALHAVLIALVWRLPRRARRHSGAALSGG